MKQLMPIPLLFVLAVAGSMLSVPAWSVTPATPPAIGASTSYAASGTLTGISLTKQTMSISGNHYRFTDALRVSSSTGKPLTVQDLAPSQSVSYNVDASLSPNRPYIRDIRIIGNLSTER